MRNRIFTVLIIFIGLISCNHDDENCNPETVSSKWLLHKDIAIQYNSEFERNDYKIVNGENRLFEYNHSGAQCENIMDDEWGEKLTFSINHETDNFEFMDSEIMETNCFYQEYGAWVRHNQYQIKDGIIKGEKISDNEWEIIVSVKTTPLFTNEKSKNIEFTEVFSK